eukprot:TRINITY_DN13742_c0_g1_i1.p1 TRINITY_DN13742_c0_g1~~TRINITY_DN13742_c0_g1_i1.p1  ORF type:complete len:418 (-),score=3.19 TRINITY_DN13742_c0_g1_i1:223-1476(-)
MSSGGSAVTQDIEIGRGPRSMPGCSRYSGETTEGEGVRSKGKGIELEDMGQDGLLPETEAEATLPASEVPADAAIRDAERLSPRCELVSILCVCALAAVVGTHIRILLEDSFNYEGLHIIRKWDVLFQDLPANMVGCFFMGIVGVACKAQIARYSELIALGLTTGLMGSITTYASFNQDMAELFVTGRWEKALFGIVLGLELPFVSLLVGINAGQGLVWLWSRFQKRRRVAIQITPDNLKRRKAVAWTAAVLWLGVLLPLNIVIAAFKWGDVGKHIQAIAACISPLGVWLRWYLSRYNGGFMKGSTYAWIPWGTLAANVLASVFLTLDKMGNVQITSHVWSVWLSALGKGVMGCLSTVSTFTVEIFKLAEGGSPGKAHAYIAISMILTQICAFILYGIPVWVNEFPRAFPSHDPGDS